MHELLSRTHRVSRVGEALGDLAQAQSLLPWAFQGFSHFLIGFLPLGIPTALESAFFPITSLQAFLPQWVQASFSSHWLPTGLRPSLQSPSSIVYILFEDLWIFPQCSADCVRESEWNCPSVDMGQPLEVAAISQQLQVIVGRLKVTAIPRRHPCNQEMSGLLSFPT